MNFLVSL